MTPTYEDSVRRIETIVAELSNDARPLSDAVVLFEEAIECLRIASDQLAIVEQKVTLLVDGAEGLTGEGER
jgi:exodeoxyribonuclease VII small subunit